MDIQRKCFEESNNVNPDWSFKFDEELQQYVATDFEMTNQVDEFNEHWDTFCAGWQAAKAQAVPETQQSKQAEIDDLNAQLKAVHDSRIEFVEYCRKVESGDFVLVEKKNTEDWYLDDFEGMYLDHDGIDGSLCELDIGQVQAVEHKEYLVTESNTLYATKTWDDANDQVDCWQFFKTQEEAEKAAAYCKAKFNAELIEAQEPTDD